MTHVGWQLKKEEEPAALSQIFILTQTCGRQFTHISRHHPSLIWVNLNKHNDTQDAKKSEPQFLHVILKRRQTRNAKEFMLVMFQTSWTTGDSWSAHQRSLQTFYITHSSGWNNNNTWRNFPSELTLTYQIYALFKYTLWQKGRDILGIQILPSLYWFGYVDSSDHSRLFHSRSICSTTFFTFWNLVAASNSELVDISPQNNKVNPAEP